MVTRRTERHSWNEEISKSERYLVIEPNVVAARVSILRVLVARQLAKGCQVDFLASGYSKQNG